MELKKNNEWFDRTTGSTSMKVLGATELSLLRSLVRDLLETCNYDDTGVTDDLYDKATACAEVLGIVPIPLVDEDEGPDVTATISKGSIKEHLRLEFPGISSPVTASISRHRQSGNGRITGSSTASVTSTEIVPQVLPLVQSLLTLITDRLSSGTTTPQQD